jgi:hypothetical protein
LTLKASSRPFIAFTRVSGNSNGHTGIKGLKERGPMCLALKAALMDHDFVRHDNISKVITGTVPIDKVDLER